MNPFQGLGQYLDLVKGNVDKLGESSMGNIGKIGNLIQQGVDSGLIGGLAGALLKNDRPRMAGDRMGMDSERLSAFSDEERPNRRQMMIRFIGGDDDRPLLDQFFRQEDQRRLFTGPFMNEIG
jgi:hypothetical protein